MSSSINKNIDQSKSTSEYDKFLVPVMVHTSGPHLLIPSATVY